MTNAVAKQLRAYLTRYHDDEWTMHEGRGDVAAVVVSSDRFLDSELKGAGFECERRTDRRVAVTEHDEYADYAQTYKENSTI